MFAISGFTKLRDPGAASEAIVRFGITSNARPSMGRLLGVFESALALALVTGVLLRWSLAAASILLSVFAFLVGRALLAGEHFTCGCFGEKEPITPWTLVRVGSLGAIAISALTLSLTRVQVRTLSPKANALEIYSALAVIGLVALISRVPELLRWNASPFPKRSTS